MADDELIIPIDKQYWPRGVVRGLTPLLRDLGDKHGNLVIAAVPSKHIMIKGPADRIEEVKEPLRALIEEHFPDAPTPEELGGEGEGAWEEEAPAPAPEPPKPQPKPEPKKEKAAPAKPKADTKAAPVASGKAVAGRKHPRPAAMCSPDLLWECVKGNSSFLRKRRDLKRPFSAEPCNLLGLHSRKFSGLVASEAIDVRPVKAGRKESVEIVQSHAKPSRHRRPSSALVTTGISKCAKKGAARLTTEVDTKYYRRDVSDLVQAKYAKIRKTFKTKKRIVKSRRNTA